MWPFLLLYWIGNLLDQSLKAKHERASSLSLRLTSARRPITMEESANIRRSGDIAPPALTLQPLHETFAVERDIRRDETGRPLPGGNQPLAIAPGTNVQMGGSSGSASGGAASG